MIKPKSAIRILLVEDHTLVRQGIASLITASQGLDIVAQAASQQEAVHLAKTCPADIFLVDLSLPDASGFSLIDKLHRSYPGTKIMVLTMHKNPAYIKLAFKHGAVAYLNKDEAFEMLIAAIHQVVQGKKILGGSAQLEIIDPYINHQTTDSRLTLSTLTKTEKNIVREVVKGKTSKEIATLTHSSPRTIETHRANILKKLKFSSTTQLIKVALKSGQFS